MACEGSGVSEAGNSGAKIEIKIKTMDSQTYTLQVDKQMPVPALKECIASVTGVVTDQQRLICRGKVLKDDQLLSAYHVEDGHTLHLVVREPGPLPSENTPVDSASDPSQTGNRGHVFQLAPGIVVEAYTMPGQGDRGLSDVSRIVSAVLNSMGITNTGSSSEIRGQSQAENRQEAPLPGGTADTTQTSAGQSGVRSSNDRARLPNAFGISAGVPFGSVQAPVILDALSTLSQYLSHMREEFLSGGNVEESSNGASSGLENAGASEQSANALPTPASLAVLLSTTREALNQIGEECLLQLARQLETHENMTNSEDRASAQSASIRTGVLLQNMGAYFLELGRTVSTLRFGRSPSEAVVNAGPAIYISPSGPNPLMVQPLPFQPGSSFGSVFSDSPLAGSGLANGIGAGVTPRRIDIQIRRVSPSSVQQTEAVGPQQPSASVQRQASPVVIGVTRNIQPATGISDSPPANSVSGVRVLPPRTMMAGGADVNRPQPEAGSLEFLYSLLGRNPNMASGNSSSRVESQGADGVQTPMSTAFQQNVEGSAADGRGESVRSRTIEIDILTSGGIPSSMNGEGQMSANILQMMRGLFPGGELHVESVNSEGTTAAEQGGPPSDESEARVTEEGLFFSRMLQQIMPLIETSTSTSAQRDDTPSTTHGEGSESRNSEHRNDDNDELPSPKRQKTD